MAELKACPGCGHKNPLVVNRPWNGGWIVTCRKCQICGPTRRFKFAAKRAWNRMKVKCAKLPVW